MTLNNQLVSYLLRMFRLIKKLRSNLSVLFRLAFTDEGGKVSEVMESCQKELGLTTGNRCCENLYFRS